MTLADFSAASEESRLRALVVDDSPLARMALRSLLRCAVGKALDVVEAASQEEALAAFAAERFSMVFLDLMLDLQRTGESGGSSGLLALDVMRKERPEVPIIIVTSLAPDDPDVLSAWDLGADALLSKPVTLEGLQRALDSADARDVPPATRAMPLDLLHAG